jgi:hypothetical protein
MSCKRRQIERGLPISERLSLALVNLLFNDKEFTAETKFSAARVPMGKQVTLIPVGK